MFLLHMSLARRTILLRGVKRQFLGVECIIHTVKVRLEHLSIWTEGAPWAKGTRKTRLQGCYRNGDNSTAGQKARTKAYEQTNFLHSDIVSKIC